ncbi:TPA: hypothetical protein HA278_00190, partial [Candidatus Woesearchaeota archaeon]|nr:hypothetical protein [Candidatus Woesearchaeota archaeon]
MKTTTIENLQEGDIVIKNNTFRYLVTEKNEITSNRCLVSMESLDDIDHGNEVKDIYENSQEIIIESVFCLKERLNDIRVDLNELRVSGLNGPNHAPSLVKKDPFSSSIGGSTSRAAYSGAAHERGMDAATRIAFNARDEAKIKAEVDERIANREADATRRVNQRLYGMDITPEENRKKHKDAYDAHNRSTCTLPDTPEGNRERETSVGAAGKSRRRDRSALQTGTAVQNDLGRWVARDAIDYRTPEEIKAGISRAESQENRNAASRARVQAYLDSPEAERAQKKRDKYMKLSKEDKRAHREEQRADDKAAAESARTRREEAAAKRHDELTAKRERAYEREEQRERAREQR